MSTATLTDSEVKERAIALVESYNTDVRNEAARRELYEYLASIQDRHCVVRFTQTYIWDNPQPGSINTENALRVGALPVQSLEISGICNVPF